jgi:outer membrane receptor protein involved in Fe transport
LQGNLSDIPGISLHNPFTGAPTASVIPQGNFDSFATKYIALGSRLIPSANLPGPAGTINRSVQSDELQTDNFVDARVDYSRSEKDSFFVRFGFGNSSIIQPALTAYTTSTPYNARNGVIGWTHVFSPTLVNEYHFGYDRVNNRPVQPYGPGVGSENFNAETGLVGANTYKACDSPATVGITGLASFGSYLCDITISNNYINNDSLAYMKGKHSLQFGTDLTRYQVTDPIFNGQPGAFYYTGQYSGNGLADFLLGYVQSMNALTKTAIPYRRSWNWGLFAEDKYQITRNLTINAGLRWELPQPAYDKENNLAAFVPDEGFAPNTGYCFQWAQAKSDETIAGQPVCPPTYGRAIVRTNYHDFAPRVGLAWMPFGKPKWAVRASFGIFYQTLLFNEEVFNSLGFPVVEPYGLSGTSSTPVSTVGQFGSAGPSLGGYLLTEDPNRSDPYVQQWTLSVQRQLPGSAMLTVAYLGNRGNHLFVRTQYNVAHLGTTPLVDRLPFPSLGAILDDKSVGQSDYNGLQIDLEKRLSHNLTFRVGYTYSNAMDDSQFTAENSEMLPWDVQDGWARSGYNLKQNFVFSHTYVLPIGAGQRFLGTAHGAVNKLVSGWQSVGILTARSGWGYTMGAIGLSNTNTEFFGGARPLRTCSGRLSNPTINEWFDTSCFSVAPANTWGNAGYNFLDAPGYLDWDLSAVKNTKLTEKINLQFRAEFFNAFNRANFGFPNTSVTEPVSSNPLLGVISSAGAGREIQGVLRLVW